MTQKKFNPTILLFVLTAIDDRLASTTASFVEFSKAITENVKRQSTGLAYVEQKVGVYREQATSLTNTITTLEKLSKTDPQLLAKYSKVFFLNENYAPARVSPLPNSYKYSDAKTVTVHSDVLPHLQKMIDDASRAGMVLFVSSGYRSFDEQKNLKGIYNVTYGAGTANQFSADQGYSEHQLGTAVDLTTTGLGGALDGFEKTQAYGWLLTNAYKYGFVLSYPPNNQFYEFEPWHWRYVGIKLATDLRTAGAFFYDWDQRKIDGYLENVFE